MENENVVIVPIKQSEPGTHSTVPEGSDAGSDGNASSIRFSESLPLQKVHQMKNCFSIEAVKTNQLSIASDVGDTSRNFTSLFERNILCSAISADLLQIVTFPIVLIAFWPIIFFAHAAKTFHQWSEVDQPPA
ncbi:hypothetical protein SH528x_000075 [Novipirellula sp. SH528]|uniref:hypothetical protein n=1 Tax=Novipirellula sp. SH528 TaxID=3454466 RepID=UPI003F9F3ED6